MKQLIVIISAIAFFSCNQQNHSNKIASTNFYTAYKSATFTDAGRMEKIMQAFPVIDKIFKDYADSNHLPGVAYGLVVDGKLVYKGNIGYTDIEKKIPVTSSSLFRNFKMAIAAKLLLMLAMRNNDDEVTGIFFSISV